MGKFLTVVSIFGLALVSTVGHGQGRVCKATCYWFYTETSLGGYPIADQTEVSVPFLEKERDYKQLIQKCKELGEEKFSYLSYRPALLVIPYPFRLLTFDGPGKSASTYIYLNQDLAGINKDQMCQ